VFQTPLISFVQDVSENNALWGGYQYNGVYKLKMDMFLMDNGEYPTLNKEVIVAPRAATRGVYDLFNTPPQSIAEYRKNKGIWKSVKAIVRKGTRVKCNRLLKYIALGFGGSLHVHAIIMEGPFRGKEVEIGDLSLSKYDKETDLYLLSPNPKLLSYERASLRPGKNS